MVGIEAKADSRNIYALAAPTMLDLPNVGSAKDFNLEACIALEPDLVILPKKLSEPAETLSSMGIPVLLVDPESGEQLREAISLIGPVSYTHLKGVQLQVRKVAPLGDPMELNVRNYELSVRKADAEMIEVE